MKKMVNPKNWKDIFTVKSLKELPTFHEQQAFLKVMGQSKYITFFRQFLTYKCVNLGYSMLCIPSYASVKFIASIFKIYQKHRLISITRDVSPFEYVLSQMGYKIDVYSTRKCKNRFVKYKIGIPTSFKGMPFLFISSMSIHYREMILTNIKQNKLIGFLHIGDTTVEDSFNQQFISEALKAGYLCFHLPINCLSNTDYLVDRLGVVALHSTVNIFLFRGTTKNQMKKLSGKIQKVEDFMLDVINNKKTKVMYTNTFNILFQGKIDLNFGLIRFMAFESFAEHNEGMNVRAVKFIGNLSQLCKINKDDPKYNEIYQNIKTVSDDLKKTNPSAIKEVLEYVQKIIPDFTTYYPEFFI